MYGSGLSYTRYRPVYDDTTDRFIRNPKESWQTSPSWVVRPSATHVNKQKGSDEPMANSSHSNTPRRTRYSRSSTTSVAQLLSDSCTSLLQKLTTRVRGPSAVIERSLTTTTSPPAVHTHNPLTTSKSSTVVPNLGATRTRLEDKYSSVLDKIYGRKRDPEKTIEPSVGRTLCKSSTTTSVHLSEKAYPYVTTNNLPREKTPYRSDIRPQQHRRQYPEPPYTFLDRDSVYRVRHRSNHSELRPRRSSKPQRTGKSEANERRTTTNLKLCPVDIPLNDEPPAPALVHSVTKKSIDKSNDDEATPTPSAPDSVSEREAKRKEIQSLIMKYSALDEAYNRASGVGLSSSGNSGSVIVAQPSVAAAITKKYYPNLVPAVSNGQCVVSPSYGPVTNTSAA